MCDFRVFHKLKNIYQNISVWLNNKMKQYKNVFTTDKSQCVAQTYT